jgi:hypothetical protein
MTKKIQLEPLPIKEYNYVVIFGTINFVGYSQTDTRNRDLNYEYMFNPQTVNRSKYYFIDL